MDLPFRVSAAILALKMQTLMQTVALLQFFKIFPKEGTCAKCDHKVIGEVKKDNNYLFWWCSDCRFKTPVRQGTVLSNSNMKVCPNKKRTKKALWPIIQANILPQTTIMSYGWMSYRKLPSLGYNHEWVDHSKDFCQPGNPTVNTNIVEGLWRVIER